MTLKLRGIKPPKDKDPETCPLELVKYKHFQKVPADRSIDITTHQPVGREVFLPNDREFDDLSPGEVLYLLHQFEDELAYYKRLLDKRKYPAASPAVDLRDTEWKHRRPQHEKIASLDGAIFNKGSLQRDGNLYIPASDGSYKKVTIEEMIEYYERKTALAEQRLAFLEDSKRSQYGNPGIIYTENPSRPGVSEIGKDLQKKL